MPKDCQATTLVIGQANPATQMCTEDAVLFNQIRDARQLLVGPPAGHGHHEQPNGSDIHDCGSLPHPLNDEQKPASAEKWDTTRCRLISNVRADNTGPAAQVRNVAETTLRQALTLNRRAGLSQT